MPSAEVKIWLALKERIESIPLNMPEAWPAETFDPPGDANRLDPYLRIGRVSVDPVPVFIDTGKRHQRTGTLVVTLVHPLRRGYSAAVYDQYAGQVAQHFADGTQMLYDDVCVTVTAQPHAQTGFEEVGYWVVPVTIPWRAYA